MATNTLVAQQNDSTSFMNEMLNVDPFRSLYVHFGMLLGVDDFQTLDAYHRGKMWYQNAWLHGKGVVWGLDVLLPHRVDEDSGDMQYNGEIRVQSGMAYDGAGRELLLPHAACLNVSAWYEANKDDPDLQSAIKSDEDTAEEESTDVVFDAHVVIQFDSCLARQVPALSESCDTGTTNSAYSRVVESVSVLLKPGLAPELTSPSPKVDYHRLHLLFGLVEPRNDTDGNILNADADVLSARAEIMAADAADKHRLSQKWFEHFAILDGIDIGPSSETGNTQFAHFPEQVNSHVVLANIRDLSLSNVDDTWRVVSAELDPYIRPFLLPTNTIQSLLSNGIDTSAPTVSPSPTLTESDAGGPRVDPESVRMIDTENLRYAVSGPPLMKASVDAIGMNVSAFDTRDGWINCHIKEVSYLTDEKEVNVELRDAPGGRLIRLIVKGTGESPVMSRNRIPLAGELNGPAGSIHQGNDFVFMFRARRGS